MNALPNVPSEMCEVCFHYCYILKVTRSIERPGLVEDQGSSFVSSRLICKFWCSMRWQAEDARQLGGKKSCGCESSLDGGSDAQLKAVGRLVANPAFDEPRFAIRRNSKASPVATHSVGRLVFSELSVDPLTIVRDAHGRKVLGQLADGWNAAVGLRRVRLSDMGVCSKQEENILACVDKVLEGRAQSEGSVCAPKLLRRGVPRPST